MQLQLGNRGLVRPSIDFTGALTESGNLQYRLNVLYRSEESFRDYEDGFDRFLMQSLQRRKPPQRAASLLYRSYSSLADWQKYRY